MRTDGGDPSDCRVSDGLFGNDRRGGMKHGSVMGIGSTVLLVDDVCGLRGWIRSDDNYSFLHGAVHEG